MQKPHVGAGSFHSEWIGIFFALIYCCFQGDRFQVAIIAMQNSYSGLQSYLQYAE